MKEQLEQRLQELKAEFESGQQMLADLEAKQTNLKNSLLRISGAIQVLEEELAKCNNPNGKPAEQSDMNPVETMASEKEAVGSP